MTADFNGDSHMDLAVGVFNTSYPESPHVAIFIGDGTGSFIPGQKVSVPDVSGLVTSDFNADSKLDIAVATYFADSVAVALGDGTGNFGSAIQFSLKPGHHYPAGVAAGDFNGDGKPDLVTANYGTQGASVLLNVPLVKITTPDPSASEPGTDIGKFKVARTGCINEPLSVYYTVSGTAQPGTDYKARTGHVTIPAGNADANIKVVPLDDTIQEPSETVIATLSNNPYYTVGAKSSATVTIYDND